MLIFWMFLSLGQFTGAHNIAGATSMTADNFATFITRNIDDAHSATAGQQPPVDIARVFSLTGPNSFCYFLNLAL